MNKPQAKHWYQHHMSTMNGFERYYETWKQWFDSRKYELEQPCKKAIEPTYTEEQAPLYNDLVRQYNKYFATTGCTSSIQGRTADLVIIDDVICKQEEGITPMNGYVEDFAIQICERNGAGFPCKKSGAAAGALAIQVNSPAPATPEVDQRKYLISRLRDLSYTKREELRKQFFMDEPEAPKSAKETLERLKAGLYTVKVPKDELVDSEDEDEDFGGYFYWRDHFSWRTPETKADKAGYKLAQEAFSKFSVDAETKLHILSPIDGLAVLKEVQDWKYSAPTAKATK